MTIVPFLSPKNGSLLLRLPLDKIVLLSACLQVLPFLLAILFHFLWLCVRGDLQLEGVDFFKTYAPVVSWLSVRTCLILSAVLNLQTVQADYSNAFAQAYLEEEIYMKLQQG